MPAEPSPPVRLGYLARRRAKIVAGLVFGVAVLAAIGWGAWEAALPAWVALRPDLRVRYTAFTNADGQPEWRVVYEQGDSGQIIDRGPVDPDTPFPNPFGFPPDLAAVFADPATGRDASPGSPRAEWEYFCSGTWGITAPARVVRRHAPAGRWVDLDEGEGVALFDYVDRFGRPCRVRCWCVPNELVAINPPADWETPADWEPTRDGRAGYEPRDRSWFDHQEERQAAYITAHPLIPDE